MASSASLTGSALPAATGTPAPAIRLRALILSPICSIASGDGPIQTRPASITRWANEAVSARDPHPGRNAPPPGSPAPARIRAGGRWVLAGGRGVPRGCATKTEPGTPGGLPPRPSARPAITWLEPCDGQPVGHGGQGSDNLRVVFRAGVQLQPRHGRRGPVPVGRAANEVIEGVGGADHLAAER